MSPQIIWRDDGPLLLPGEVVAGSTRCCCENPPPEVCVCPDLCVYKLAMTSPTNLSTQFTCDTVAGTTDSYTGACLHPVSLSGWSLDPPICTLDSGTNFFSRFKKKDLTTALVVRSPTLILGKIRHESDLFRCFNSPVSFQGSTFAGAWARWSVELVFQAGCGYIPQSFSIYYGSKHVSVRITPVAAFLAGNTVPSYSRTVAHSLGQPVPLDSSCSAYDRRKYCSGLVPSTAIGDVLYLDGDATFSVPSILEGASTVYDDTINNLAGWPNSVISSAASALYAHCESASASFTITSRASCQSKIACNCATSLAGLKVMFEGKEFVMGTEATVSESGAYFETWTHDAPGTFRYRKNDLSNNETYIEKEVEVYCQTDNAASPPVDRWYAAFINWCKDEANYATTYNEDYFIGYFECEPASDCAPFAAETSIPTGSPIDVERVDGWPQGSGCTVPGPATITLSQDCG